MVQAMRRHALPSCTESRTFLSLRKPALFDLDPNDGKVRWQFAFRSGAFESVNATSPLIYGDIVMFSASLQHGIDLFADQT